MNIKYTSIQNTYLHPIDTKHYIKPQVLGSTKARVTLLENNVQLGESSLPTQVPLSTRASIMGSLRKPLEREVLGWDPTSTCPL